MEFWHESEIRMRRRDAIDAANCRRLMRLAESGRSSSVRRRIANGAQAMSDVLGSLARNLRAGDPA
jgi:hypothetical protein